MVHKKTISYREFMLIQTRWIIFYCNIHGLDYLEAAEKFAGNLRAKLESKYTINF